MTQADQAEWGRFKRLSFRFSLVYFVLYYLPFPLNAASGTDWIDQGYEAVWHGIVRFVGRHLFHRDITVFTNGSGDTTYDYIRLRSWAHRRLTTCLPDSLR